MAQRSQSEPSSAWPPLEWETLEWRASVLRWSERPGRTGLAPKTYTAAVPAHIADRDPSSALDGDALAFAAEAQGELARLDSELGSGLDAFGPLLLRSEAASSSRIENLTASARSILKAELGVKASPNSMDVLANTRAMRAALEVADSLNADAVLHMHSELMNGQRLHPPGRFRQEPVWIGRSSESPIGADYVAPQALRVPELVEDLLRFGKRSDIPALVLTAVAHAQFETIHPFTDGNGRTGRALVQALLRHHGVTRSVGIPVSAGLLVDISGYHEALTAYRRGDISPIVRMLALASMRACENTRRLVGDIERVRAQWEESLDLRRSSNAWRLLDVITRRPVIDAKTAAEELGIAASNAYAPLRALAKAGILKETREYRFGSIWSNADVLRALDDFVERAGRRTWA